MLTGKHIENARIHANIPIYIMCNAMNLDTEQDYAAAAKGSAKPTVYQ